MSSDELSDCMEILLVYSFGQFLIIIISP